MKHFYIIAFLFSSFAFSQIPSGYYDSTNGLDGYSLKTALKTIIDGEDDGNGQPFHDTTVTYGQLWELYEISDVRPDGKVWDMYSDCDFTFVTDQDTGSSGTEECEKFNREHSFPRSWFGDDQGIAIFADPFHVIPSDKKVNGIRGNLAFGEVSSANYTSLNGAKRGTSAISGPTGDVFEPADEYKGDIARGLFYVATRYEDLIANWETNDTDGDSMLDGTSNKVFEQWALDMLYSWHVNDPVSQKELDRNEAIFAHQNNRNPFIDNPQFVSEIWQSVLSVPTTTLEDAFVMHPNPVKHTLNIELKNKENTRVEIYDVLGKNVFRKNINSSDRIDLQSLKTGVYILRLTQNHVSISKRLIKN